MKEKVTKIKTTFYIHKSISHETNLWEKPLIICIDLRNTKGGDFDIDNESFWGIPFFGS